MKDLLLPKKEKLYGIFEKTKSFAVYLSPIIFSALLSSAKMPLSTYPLGFSLIASARRDTPLFFVGGMLFSLISKNIPLAIGYISIIIFRFIFSRLSENRFSFSFKKDFFSLHNLFCEGESLKMAVATLGAFTAGMLRTVFGGFSVGDLVGTVFCIAICPAVSYLFSGYFTASEKQGFRYEAGYVSLLVALVFSLSKTEFFGISLSVFFASVVTFMLAKSKSPSVSSLFALLSIIAANPLLSPAFAVSAFLSAALDSRSKIYSVCVGAISFASVSYFVGGVGLFASSFPEFMMGALASIPIKKEVLENFLPFFGYDEARKAVADAKILTYREKKGRESIEDISKTFESLSKTFFELSDKNTRIGLFDTRKICDRVCDRYCRKCAAQGLCWERDYALTLDVINKISAKIYKIGKVEISDLPKEFLSRCPSAEKLIFDIEKENARVLRSLIKEDKTRAFAMDYAVFSKILNEALEKNEAEYSPDARLREKVKDELSKIGFTCDSIGVYGARCKKVYAFRLSKTAVKCKADDIKKALSSALSTRIEEPIFEFCDGGINMSVKTAPIIKTEVSTYSEATEKGDENGDAVRVFEGKNGYSYALINDGMGSGRAAAKKSVAAAIFLEKMLMAGNSISSGIEMLAALERADSEEGFTTIDLLEADTLSGNASFIKSGAAPSFVKRGTKLFKIRSKTFPLGILDDVDAERTTFSCQDGDKIIMLSDGVTEDNEEPLWLCEFLTQTDLSDPDAAKKIVCEAKKHTLCRDDMSAAVITVSKIE